MKLLSSVFLFLIGGCAALADAPPPSSPPPPGDSSAPTSPANPPGRGRHDPGQWLSFLTPAEREQMETDRQKALANNPSLKEEEAQMRSDRESMRDSTPTKDERMAFREKMRSHQQKMREAMLKEDPSLAPVIQKIEQHLSQARSERDRQPPAPPSASSAAPSTNKAPIAPPVPTPSAT